MISSKRLTKRLWLDPEFASRLDGGMDTGHEPGRKLKPRMGFRNVVPSVLIACLAATAPSMAEADIYSWTDADGVRH